MAAKDDTQLTTTIRDDFLTCKICFNIYEQPKILPCVHTYCCPCLEKLASTSEKPGSVSCPECRECVDLPHNNVSDLKTNFLINSLIEVLKVKTNKDVKCTTCDLRGKSSPAESRCLDCGDYLCASCSDGHNASSATWNHNTVLLEDIKTGSYDEQLRTLQRLTCCQHKDKEIEYFCDTCRVPMCLSCVLLIHRDHKCLTAAEAVKAQKDRLVGHIIKVKEKLNRLENEQKVICENLARMNKFQSQAKASIGKQIKSVFAVIERHKQLALELVGTKMKERLNQCNMQVEEADLKVTLAKGCLEFCEAIMKQGKDEEVLYLEDTLTKRLVQIEELPSAKLKPIARAEFPDIDDEIWGILDLENVLKKHVDTLIHELHSKLHFSSETVDNLPNVSFQLLRTFDSKHKTDQFHPVIKGITISNNTLYLSDNANGKIKCLSTSGILQKCVTVEGDFSPYAVAVCQNVTGAVHENYLFLFNKEDNFALKLMLTEKPPTGQLFTFTLADYKNEGFIVGNLPENQFRIYGLDGKLQYRLAVQVSYPLANLSFTVSGLFLTCEWGDNSVRIRDPRAENVTLCRISSHRPLVARQDGFGLIYVVNRCKSLVSVFDGTGTQVLQYDTKQDALRNPVNVTFDDEGLMYVVGKSGEVNIYKVLCKR